MSHYSVSLDVMSYTVIHQLPPNRMNTCSGVSSLRHNLWSRGVFAHFKGEGNYEFNPSPNINLRWCNTTFLRSNGDILLRKRFVKNMALWWQVITNQTEDVSVADLISGREVMEELGNEIMIPNRRSSFNSRIG